VSALKNRGCKSDQTLHPPKRPLAPSHHTRCVQCAVDLPSRTKNGRKVCRLGVVWRVEPNCLLLHVRSIFNPVSTWWPENCSPQISDHVCHMSASRLTHVNERAHHASQRAQFGPCEKVHRKSIIGLRTYYFTLFVKLCASRGGAALLLHEKEQTLQRSDKMERSAILSDPS